LEFLNFGQVLVTLINWLLKPKCMLKHIYFFEVFFVVWKYDVIFSLRDLVVCMKTKTHFFSKFWRKPGILIPNLYFYDVKIQINIKQNLVEEYAEESQIFENIFFWIFFGPGRTQPTHFGLGQTVNSGALSTVHNYYNTLYRKN
jgi:hypothetical protein